jgi:hypothetical protein
MANVRLIDNHSEYGEYSRSVAREDGTTLDICAMRNDHKLVIAVVDSDEVHVEEIAFSFEELQVLFLHLGDPITQAILRGENESDI